MTHLSDIVNDKSLLVIGNWKEQKFRETDLIVRFNRSTDKTDIWCPIGIPPSHINAITKNNYGYIFNLVGRSPSNIRDQINVDNAIYDECKKDINITIPFTGTFFIWYLLKYCSPSEIYITGFNCFKHKPLQSKHEANKEKEWEWIQTQVSKKNIVFL